jgi:hypothetical protein
MTMIRTAVLAASSAAILAGCAADRAAELVGKATGKPSGRHGTWCIVLDTTYSGRLNAPTYAEPASRLLQNLQADNGPARVCVIDVTGNPSVSSTYDEWPLTSEASRQTDRDDELDNNLADIKDRATAALSYWPDCPKRTKHPEGKPGSTVIDESHGSAVFETVAAAARSAHLRAGDSIFVLSDGIERVGRVNFTTTHLLGPAAPQPAGRRELLARIRANGGAPRTGLRGIHVVLPRPGSQRCGAQFSNARGEQIRALWEDDWERATGTDVKWSGSVPRLRD